MKRRSNDKNILLAALPCVLVLFFALAISSTAQSNSRESRDDGYLFNDSHFHLTNYIQEGTDIRDFLRIMGNRTNRVAIFGLPLQQEWSYERDGDRAPTYYLQSDAPLYYYSFTDAMMAMAYKSLSNDEQARFDPMIIGFNPADMYAADHVRRVLQTFPGVFSGIGEFSVHKEFVSAKIAGGGVSLTDPALDRLLDFAGEVGLVVLIHSDIDIPFAKEGTSPAYLERTRELFKRHPKTTIIWAHLGVGRIVRPLKQHGVYIEEMIKDPAFSHVFYDLSWSEVAKYAVSTPETTQNMARFLNQYPDRFLFGTDEVAPPNQDAYMRVYNQYAPLWALLDKSAKEKICKGNYERIFDEAKRKVRAWEKSHPK